MKYISPKQTKNLPNEWKDHSKIRHNLKCDWDPELKKQTTLEYLEIGREAPNLSMNSYKLLVRFDFLHSSEE